MGIGFLHRLPRSERPLQPTRDKVSGDAGVTPARARELWPGQSEQGQLRALTVGRLRKHACMDRVTLILATQI